MASALRIQSTPSEMSTLAPPFSIAEHLYRGRDRQRRGSVASTSSRRVLPRKESCLLDSQKTSKESSDASRRRDASICSALGEGSADSIISTLRAEERATLGMGLREQEQVRHFLLHLLLATIPPPHTNIRF